MGHLNFDLGPLELIIQRPKIDFDILLGAKGLFAKEQNHRFNQRFSTLLLLTFDFEGGTQQQQHKASIALRSQGNFGVPAIISPSLKLYGERLLGGNLSSNYR